MTKSTLNTITGIFMMFLLALGAHAQMPLGITPQRELNSKPVDNSLFAKREAMQRKLALGRQNNPVQTPRLTLPAPQQKAPFSTSAGAVFQGTLLANLAWPANNPKYGIYEVSSASPTLKSIYLDTEGIMYAEYGSAIIGTDYWMVIGYDYGGYGTIYVKYKFDLSKMAWDAGASEIIPNQDYKYLAWTNTPYDSKTKRAYGYFYTSDGESLEFCKMDYATLNRTKIADPQHVFMAMAIDENDGQLYAIDTQGDLYKIDKTNGNETLVGNTGILPSTYHQAAAIDSRQGKLYWAFVEEDLTSGFAEVDLYNADAFKCFEFEKTVQFGDLYLTASGVDDYAPSMVEDLGWHYNATNPNLIDLSFTMPTLTNNAVQALGDDLRYVVKLADQQVASAAATPGERVSVTVEGLPTSQQLRLGVCAANNVGEGGMTFTDVWAGFDTPAEPTEVTLTIDSEGNALLNWAASTTGKHGGYVAPGSVSYHVYSEPDGELLTTTTATTYSAHYDPSNLKYLFFSVDAVSSDFPTPSEKSFSNKAPLGESITPPYEVRFDDINKIDAYWTIIDANRDGETWFFEDIYDVMRQRVGLRGNNDWMLSPPLYLEKGKQYSVEFEASTAYGGKMRMAYGKASINDPAQYEQLMETTAIAPDDPTPYSALLTVEEDGIYRIGLQEVAPTGIYTELYSFAIGEGVAFDAPAAPTELAVVPAPEGALGATISFNAPTLALNGRQLSHIDQMQIFREGTLIGTIDQDVTPGKALTFADNTIGETGMTKYSVRAVSDAGVGEMASASAYIGADEPTLPTMVTLTDNANGTVTVNWQNSTIGKHGGWVDQSKVENTLYNVENNQLTKKIVSLTGKSAYTLTASMAGDPAWYYIGVTAKGEGGEESQATLGRIIKGDPAGIPIEDSFANQQIHESRFWWGTPLEGTSNWGMSSTSADDDGGSLMFITKAPGDKAVIGTRKITLQGTTSPKLIFKYYSPAASTGTLTIQIDRGQRGIIDDVATIDMATDNAGGGWQQTTIDLADYTADKYIIIRFVATAPTEGAAVGVDDFRLGEFLTDDLSIEAEWPATVITGQVANLTLKVTNRGTSTTSGEYRMETLFDDEDMGFLDDLELAPGETRIYTNVLYTDKTMEGTRKFTARVNYAADQQPNNNVVTGEIVIDNYPTTAINDLKAEANGKYVHLTWTNPTEEVKAISTITDDFESYTTWSTDFEPWTCIDNDGGLTGGIFNGVSFPHQGEALAFLIFNPNSITEKATQQVPELTPRSGSQYAASIYSVDPATNYVTNQDNWLISPLLPGIPQTITLYAKTMNSAYPNAQVELLYSTTGNAQDNFTKLGDTYHISDIANWTKIEATLPMGTTYFALRDVSPSDDAFMLMVDDVTYTALGEGSLPITGYNVYLNGNFYATVKGQLSAYDAGPFFDGTQNLQLTVRYGDEMLESELSNVASATTDIKSITADDIADQDVTVYSTSGALVAEGRQATRHLPKGVYIVKVKATGEVMKMEK